MRPIRVTKAPGTGSTAWIPLDINLAPFSVTVSVVINGATNYTVEYTTGDLWTPGATLPVFPHATLAAQTADGTGNFAFPVTGTRLTINSGNAGTGAQFTVLQGLKG